MSLVDSFTFAIASAVTVSMLLKGLRLLTTLSIGIHLSIGEFQRVVCAIRTDAGIQTSHLAQ
jgi:hypothetical protein